MPRAAREKSKTGIYHIILRGINRQEIFEEEEDFIKFLNTLKEYQKISGYKLYAYCLMSNHIHLLLKEEKEELGVAMRRIGASFVYWYNWKYERCGHLFQDRYKSEPVEDDQYFLTVLRYIHQNPLKAGLVKNIADYKWNSYGEYIEKPQILDADFALGLFSDDREKAIDRFKRFHDTIGYESCLEIEEKKKLKDDEAKEIINRICNIPCSTKLQLFESNNRNQCLKMLKEEGLSTRQIARLTGISRGIIIKA